MWVRVGDSDRPSPHYILRRLPSETRAEGKKNKSGADLSEEASGGMASCAPASHTTSLNCISLSEPDINKSVTLLKQIFYLDGGKPWSDIIRRHCKRVAKAIARIIALALDLDAGFFDKPAMLGEAIATLRLLHYEGANQFTDKISNPEKGVFGAGAHSDYGLITLLATDDVAGLQICKDRDAKPQVWEYVAPVKGGFIVNLGDMLERWSNCVFREKKRLLPEKPTLGEGISLKASVRSPCVASFSSPRDRRFSLRSVEKARRQLLSGLGEQRWTSRISLFSLFFFLHRLIPPEIGYRWSTLHRVVLDGRERYSIAYFVEPSHECLVECLPTCKSDTNPPK
ncbi:hypothetical protein B296_00041255 [Ensete ventricosum]|uniref:Fe2OG dioxygenase domain-containing protein n=1 Tax=Ensete ventricosum TaxID=4639 RepID=A0A426ZML1_ENSVE|nr:hypothetical protein B296_00041255 [Ensete ventricosum]